MRRVIVSLSLLAIIFAPGSFAETTCTAKEVVGPGRSATITGQVLERGTFSTGPLKGALAVATWDNGVSDRWETSEDGCFSLYVDISDGPRSVDLLISKLDYSAHTDRIVIDTPGDHRYHASPVTLTKNTAAANAQLAKTVTVWSASLLIIAAFAYLGIHYWIKTAPKRHAWNAARRANAQATAQAKTAERERELAYNQARAQALAAEIELERLRAPTSNTTQPSSPPNVVYIQRSGTNPWVIIGWIFLIIIILWFLIALFFSALFAGFIGSLF